MIKILRFSLLLTLVNLFAACLMFEISGWARFIPTVAQLVSILLALHVVINGKFSRDRNTSIILLWSVYVIIQTIFIDNSVHGVIPTILKSLYWCSFYFVTKSLIVYTNHKKIDKFITIISIIFIASSLFSIFSQQSLYRLTYGDIVGVNSVFFPLLLLPLIGLIDSKSKRWILLILVLITVFYSLKRSATISAVFSIIIYLYYDFFRDKKGTASTKFFILLLLGAVSYYFIYSSNSPLFHVFERFDSIQEDSGNGREIIYMDVVTMYNRLPFLDQIVGKGFCKVQVDMPGALEGMALSAHNDFLEILYDFGLLGLSLYLVFCLKTLFTAFKLSKLKSTLTASYIVSIIIFLVTSMFSHLVIYPTYFLFLIAYWAIIQHKIQSSSY